MKLCNSAHLVTLARLLFCVCSDASIILVGLLSSVCSDVFQYITSLDTPIITVVTFVRLLSSVCSDMYL